MKILGKEMLYDYIRFHPNARSSIEDWILVMESVEFKSPQDIKNQFSSVDFLPKNHCIFNINGNHHRLFVKVIYISGSLLIKWIGTHSEYDKLDFSKLSKLGDR
ncbi:type II toxin-antitoxin system HigB family toxin [Gallibacterium sp. AGMB14963]|uniref:type II toxin-antitoxin system HigB family toxin n=1 Tax=Gallibacterium faecale TaxID=3019086 RepID=UPI0022F1D974|nr:type II toxin-antitoxin system HigB family toxin [Gallibacterium sp. AGMB14963]MDA3979546.1 type II toxin-antitoxin system HigB family toxin [Gallibacterium sp. AGMB14963]